jgi:hypothetical protein
MVQIRVTLAPARFFAGNNWHQGRSARIGHLRMSRKCYLKQAHFEPCQRTRQYLVLTECQRLSIIPVYYLLAGGHGWYEQVTLVGQQIESLGYIAVSHKLPIVQVHGYTV